ncbi:hypothetical protein GGI21_003069, partial [Coemansia aciculifera]
MQQHSATAADHHQHHHPQPMGSSYYQDGAGTHGAPGVVASNGMMGSWAGAADSQQYQQASNTTDTACS